MATKGRGGGRTPERVVDLIKGGVESLGVRGLSRAVGISPAIIIRYMQGKVGEPSQATLEKLADYFGVSVAYLRGEDGTASREPTAQELWVIAEIREALGVGHKPMLEELPGIVRAMREELEGLKARLEDDLK